jgi:hypothetical protein
MYLYFPDMPRATTLNELESIYRFVTLTARSVLDKSGFAENL